jgi:hypothetical protein
LGNGNPKKVAEEDKALSRETLSEMRSRIGRLGGLARAAKKVGHQWSPEEARVAGAKGARAAFAKMGPNHYQQAGKKSAAKRAAKITGKPNGEKRAGLLVPQQTSDSSSAKIRHSESAETVENNQGEMPNGQTEE